MRSCLYGQGMNSGFEDISILNEMMEEYWMIGKRFFRNIKT
jgi:2-polyprenyl-6-methoxyphenol hydroxylase-like FAD-dependent oxidoreductase